MSRPKAPGARTPLRGQGRTVEVPAAPVDQAHGQLVRELRRTGCPPLLLTAALDATWLRPADGPALALAGMILEQLTGRQAIAAPKVEPDTDSVGTVPAFPGLGGGAGTPPGEVTTEGAPPLRALAPLLVGILTGLGMTPESRARLGILLVEGTDAPEVPTPARLPRSARDRPAA